MNSEGFVAEVVLLDGVPAARLQCPTGIVPAPGQYVLGHAAGSNAPLAIALFSAGTRADGFVAAPPVPADWLPGTRLFLRGPLGHGFSMPETARRVVLVALDCSPAVLLSLLPLAVRQDASVVLVREDVPDGLPPEVEVQPPSALHEVVAWADYIAFDAPRDALPALRERLRAEATSLKAEAQVLVRTPMPCAALAECGVCTVDVGGKPRLACEDGPVFELPQLIGRSSRA